MKQLMFLNFSGVCNTVKGYSGWLSTKSDDVTIPGSPFRTFSHSYGQSALFGYQLKFAELRQAHEDANVIGMAGTKAIFGEPAQTISCPFDLSSSLTLSKQSTRMDFSGAVLYESDSIPSKLDSVNADRMTKAVSTSHLRIGFEETGSSSTVQFPHRVLMVDVVTALAPQMIETPDVNAYGEGFELGMKVAAKVTGGDA